MPNDRRYVFSTRDTIRYRFPTHTNESETSEAPPLHQHGDAEQVFYVVSGLGVLHIGAADDEFPVAPGDLVRIPRDTPHRIQCHGSERLVYLSVDCFVGGRPGAEPTWESHVRVMCRQNGWDFNQVRRT